MSTSERANHWNWEIRVPGYKIERGRQVPGHQTIRSRCGSKAEAIRQVLEHYKIDSLPGTTQVTRRTTLKVSQETRAKVERRRADRNGLTRKRQLKDYISNHARTPTPNSYTRCVFGHDGNVAVVRSKDD